MPVPLTLFQPHHPQSRFGFLKNQCCQYSGPVKLRALFITGCQNEEDENITVGVLLSPNTSLVYPQPSQSCNTERLVLSLADYSNALSCEAFGSSKHG